MSRVHIETLVVNIEGIFFGRDPFTAMPHSRLGSWGPLIYLYVRFSNYML